MPTLTRFMVQSYRQDKQGELVADEPLKFHCPYEARAQMERLAKNRAGVVAYSWVGDMKTGELGRINLLSRSGSLPVYAAIALGIEEHAA
ncbi:hypothetical protein [Methylorubrum populi]